VQTIASLQYRLVVCYQKTQWCGAGLPAMARCLYCTNVRENQSTGSKSIAQKGGTHSSIDRQALARLSYLMKYRYEIADLLNVLGST
jgi:hypothetical protein